MKVILVNNDTGKMEDLSTGAETDKAELIAMNEKRHIKRSENKFTDAHERSHLCDLIGTIVVYGITPMAKQLAQQYIDWGGKYDEFAQCIINAKQGFEKEAAREALRMILIDLNFVEVQNVRL